MISGKVHFDRPYIKILIRWGSAILDVVVLIDTGFDGDIRISPDIAQGLGLSVTHTESIRFGDGSLQNIPASLVYSEMEDIVASLEVIILPGDPYIGIGFLKKLQYGMHFNPTRNELFLKR
ncbi:MAG TPA: hypothetical protein VJI96_02385 [Candidatus Andersenbacteria bacterium]|nr:hypothetical protein [Candidatus Andersenbacteria bacterium]